MNQKLLDQLRVITEEEREILSGKSAIDNSRYMSDRSNVFDKKKLLQSGKSIQIRSHTRFIHFPKHTHNYIEVVYMCEGETHHVINSEHVYLKKGELLFLNQKATQEIYPAGERDIAINFIILPEFFEQSLSMLEDDENLVREFIIGCLTGQNDQVEFLHFKVADILPIQNLVENLVWTILNNQPNKRSSNQITMGLLLLQLSNYSDKIKSGSNYEQELMLSVLGYIEEHYRDGELSQLARYLNYDMLWLSRLIKKMTGQNYTDLVQKKRLNQAAYLLTNTKLPVDEVSIAVGYENQSYFYRIFKQKFQITPRAYRLKSERN